MGNISEHFNKEQFACKCGKCNKEFRMSMTIIGILEDLACNKNSQLEIKKGYVCDNIHENSSVIKKNYFALGKAVDFSVEKDKLIEVFRYLETFPEITGLGIDIQENYIHIDLRDKEPVKWIYLGNEEEPLTSTLREKHGLGTDVTRTKIPDPVTLATDV